MKAGDIVILSEKTKVFNAPQAMTAVKYYERLKKEIGEKHMLVLSTSKPRSNNESFSVAVLVDGYRKVLNSSFLEVISESG